MRHKINVRRVEGRDGELIELDTNQRYPVLSRATVTGVVTAALALAVSFGLDLTPRQQGAITALAGVVAPLLAAWWAQRKAWSGKTVGEVLDRVEDQVTQP